MDEPARRYPQRFLVRWVVSVAVALSLAIPVHAVVDGLAAGGRWTCFYLAGAVFGASLFFVEFKQGGWTLSRSCGVGVGLAGMTVGWAVGRSLVGPVAILIELAWASLVIVALAWAAELGRRSAPSP
jgi:hypothetical protein